MKARGSTTPRGGSIRFRFIAMSHVCVRFRILFSILAFIACHVFYGHIPAGELARHSPIPPAHTLGIDVMVTLLGDLVIVEMGKSAASRPLFYRYQISVIRCATFGVCFFLVPLPAHVARCRNSGKEDLATCNTLRQCVRFAGQGFPLLSFSITDS
jgi:hypothetical protein